jgi:hypothetical protein
MSCECPRHNEHAKNFIRKYQRTDGKFSIVDVEPGEWLVNLEHPERIQLTTASYAAYWRIL